MNDLAIQFDQGQTAYIPGHPLRGTIRWQLETAPQSLRLQLLWFTSGKGNTDVQLLDHLDFFPSQAAGTELFQFILPDSPPSFSGKLISLHWALELVAQPGSLNCKTEFVLSPSGQEIVLPHLDQPAVKLGFSWHKPK